MKMFCQFCSEELHPTYKFCPYCGGEAPRGTIVGKLTEEIIEEPIYCPHCKKENIQEALYCSDCGESIYQKPSTTTYFCPDCGTKIPTSTRHCFSCKLHIEKWFAQEGKVAEKLGWKGDLDLYEKMNEFYYHFILKDSLSLGRGNDNDIVLLCEWVSRDHCVFNNKKKEMIDLESANGTFINRNDKRVKQVKFGNIDEFNIAGVFTYTVHKSKNIFAFCLTAILDEKECRQVSDIKELNAQRKHYYILVSGDDSLHIRKFDGKIIEEIEKLEDVYSFTTNEGYLYYTDHSKDINKKLIMANKNQLPANWVLQSENKKEN